MLAELAAGLAGRPTLVSYNGLAFDVPVLGSPHYLVASCRSGIIEARDAALQLRGVTPAMAN